LTTVSDIGIYQQLQLWASGIGKIIRHENALVLALQNRSANA